jgi:hypothetical protein
VLARELSANFVFQEIPKIVIVSTPTCQ